MNQTIIVRGSALVLGAVLYLVEEVLLGYLAATTVPKAYFDFFGDHKVLALVLEEAAVVACPVFLLALAWGLAATRLVRLPPFDVARWTLMGLVIAWAARLLQTVIEWPVYPESVHSSSVALLLSLLIPPVWSVLTALSAPLGLWSAGLVARRGYPTWQRTRGRPID